MKLFSIRFQEVLQLSELQEGSQHSRSLRPSLLVAALLAYMAGPVSAQIASGTVSGRADDPSGASVAGAGVTISNLSTGLTRTVQTQSSGDFSFPQLPPGRYSLSASAPGFKNFRVNSIELQVDQTVHLDVRFELGTSEQSVEISASATPIESETSSLGQIIDTKRIVELPLNGRNFMQLANISSGVTPAYNSRSATITNQSGRADLAFHVSGGRGDANSFLIDGVETRSTWFNSPSVLLSVDAIQEFKIEKNLFSAEYGQGSGLVNLVSKSGSNEIHGSAYEFLRNDALDAANFFDNYFGKGKAPFRQNQFGAAVGGPIRKNKIFFFADWESLRSRKSNTLSALVVTPQQYTGDLTGLPSSKKDPMTGASAILDPLSGMPFAGNQIPQSRLSGVTRNFQQYTPIPNANVSGLNFITTKSTNRDDDQGSIRIDYQISAQDSLFGRYTDFESSLYQPRVSVLSGSVFPYSGQNAVLEETHIFSPAVLNVFKFGYTHAKVFNSWEITPTSIANEIGLHLNQQPDEYGLPAVGLSGGYYAGGGSGINQGGRDNLMQFSDTLSWVVGRQTLKFGADIRYLRFYQRLGLSNNGSFTFDGRYTGNAIADYLLGNPASMTAQIGLGVANWRSTSQNYFVQDDIKVTPKLTLNLGLRYEYDQPFYERDGKEGYFDTSLQKFVVGISQAESPLAVSIPGIQFNPDLQPGIWLPDRNNFGPRIGLAYGITPSLVIRSGYGMFYSKTQGNELQFKINAPPLVFAASLTGNLNSPNLSWDRDAFPDPSSPDFPISTLSPFSVDPRDRTPYIQQWNFGIEKTIGGNTLFEAAYAGSKGTKLSERVNINQASLPNPANPVALASRRPFPGFGDILSSNLQENSIYNALQLRLERRFSSGLGFLLGYTWSHSIDTASRGSGGSWHQNAYQLREDRGSSDFDVRHRFTASYVYELPVGTGKRYLSGAGKLANAFVGGWQLNGITTFMSGNYFSVTVSGDRANVGGYPFQRANRSCDGNLSRGDRTIDAYFYTSCFSLTPLGTFGNSGRNIIQIPGLNNWDFSVVKNNRFTERIRSELRLEFFDVFNHPQFDAPNTTADNKFFGQIRSARDGRISQVALKILW
jgi:hypothetical protein